MYLHKIGKMNLGILFEQNPYSNFRFLRQKGGPVPFRTDKRNFQWRGGLYTDSIIVTAFGVHNMNTFTSTESDFLRRFCII